MTPHPVPTQMFDLSQCPSPPLCFNITPHLIKCFPCCYSNTELKPILCKYYTHHLSLYTRNFLRRTGVLEQKLANLNPFCSYWLSANNQLYNLRLPHFKFDPYRILQIDNSICINCFFKNIKHSVSSLLVQRMLSFRFYLTYQWLRLNLQETTAWDTPPF